MKSHEESQWTTQVIGSAPGIAWEAPTGDRGETHHLCQALEESLHSDSARSKRLVSRPPQPWQSPWGFGSKVVLHDLPATMPLMGDDLGSCDLRFSWKRTM